MKIAKVIGRATLSKMDKALVGRRFIIASPISGKDFANMGAKAKISSSINFLACDTLGASEGDIITYVEGAEATAQFDFPIPIDAVVVSIVEKLNYQAKA